MNHPRLSVAEYQQLAMLGKLTENDNIELLDGYLVPKAAKTPLHDSRIDLLSGLFCELLPFGWFVRNQNSLITADSVPEPDLAVVRGKPGAYRISHPTAADVALVIEVADSSITLDRNKGRIYARAGIVEYWIVNLVDWRIERMTGPQPDGQFARTELFSVNDAMPVTLDGAVVGQLPLREMLTPPE
jgi:Uma2 family endonuclease